MTVKVQLIGLLFASLYWHPSHCQAGEYLFGRADFPVGSSPIGIAAADLNGDGILDLVVANSDSGSVSVLIGRRQGKFDQAVSYAALDTPVGVLIADVNGDGIPDVVAAWGNLATGGSGGLPFCSEKATEHSAQRYLRPSA